MKITNAKDLKQIALEADKDYKAEVLASEIFKQLIFKIETKALEGHVDTFITYDLNEQREMQFIKEELENNGYVCNFGFKEIQKLFNQTYRQHRLYIEWGKR